MRLMFLFPVFLLGSGAALAMPQFHTFNVGDMVPININYGVPRNTAPAHLMAGEWQFQLGYDLANTLHIESESEQYNEELLLDAETSRLTVQLEYGLADDWDLRLELPFLDTGAGSLDGFIDGFHRSLGFPEGQRPLRPEDQFAIRYQRDGVTLLDVQQEQSGFGDTSLSFVRTVESDYEDSLSYGFTFKFPTGEKVTSDTRDFSVWATSANQLAANWLHYASAGGVWIEKKKGLLAGIRNSAYGFARYGLRWQYFASMSLQAQLDYQSALYDSQTRLLGQSTSLSLGGTLYFPRQWQLDIAVVEDVDVNTSSDVVFHFNLRKRYGQSR